MRVLMVENELVEARTIEVALRGLAAVVEHVSSADEAIELTRFYSYDIIVMDIQLPGMDGYDAIRRLRAEKVETPILIVSGLNQPQCKVRGLGVGADDFLTKPFYIGEFIARIQAIIRRSRGFCKSVINIGDLSLDIENREARVNDITIHLTGKEYAVLELLIMRKGIVQTKEAFLNHLYGGLDEPEIKIIDVFICKLRKKLSKYNISNIIVTVWGRGYVIKDHEQHAKIRQNNIPFQYL